MKVLVVKLSSLGDIVNTVPALLYLKDNAKEHIELHWLVNDSFLSFVEAVSIADKVIGFNRQCWNRPLNIVKNLKNFFRLIKELRKEKYDIAIDLQCLFRSSIIPFLSGVKRRAGFDRTREGAHFFLNELAQTKNKHYHAIEENAAVIKKSFSIASPFDAKKYVLKIEMPEKENKVEKFFKEKGIDSRKMIIINPNSRWGSKKWGNDKYKQLIKRMVDNTEFSIGIIGTADEKEDIIPLIVDNKRVYDFTGQTDIISLYFIFKRVKLLVTNDSGPMHIASASLCKTLAIFGPTSPERTGPFWEKEIIKSNVKCSPCFKRVCPLKGNKSMQCMKSISVDEVFKKVIELTGI